MQFFRSTAIATAIVAVAVPAFAQSTPTPVTPPMGKVIPFAFQAQNSSGETGVVTLQARGNDTIVVISLKGTPADPQPAHIHEGTCANLNPKPLYPLANVVNGKSTTTVNVPTGRLMASHFAVNVHKSLNDIPTYVACADLSAANMRSTMSSMPAAMPAGSAMPAPSPTR